MPFFINRAIFHPKYQILVKLVSTKH
jgi:hypothetical protein